MKLLICGFSFDINVFVHDLILEQYSQMVNKQAQYVQNIDKFTRALTLYRLNFFSQFFGT